MSHYVTDMTCYKCKKGNYCYYEIGHPSSYSFHDFYQCNNCGRDPDKDKKEEVIQELEYEI